MRSGSGRVRSGRTERVDDFTRANKFAHATQVALLDEPGGQVTDLPSGIPFGVLAAPWLELFRAVGASPEEG